MAQFGGAKNPPWARDPAPSLVLPVNQQGVASLAQQQVGLANTVLAQPGVATPTVYSLGNTQPTVAPHQYTAQQMGVAQMQNAGPPPTLQPAVLSQVGPMQPGIAMPTTLATTQVATISYPAPRGNSAPQQQQQPPAKHQRVFTGTVTKLHDNFGFVDEDVFFQTSCVKGMIPKVGDRVLVEAAYNANMPFKWNAARIQVLPNQPVVAQNQGNFNQNNFPPNPVSYQVKPAMGSNMAPSVITPTTLSQPPPLMGQQTQPAGSKRDKGLLQAPPGRSNLMPSRRVENSGGGFRDRDRGRDRDRDRHSGHDRRERRSPRKRSRSPRRSKSPSTRGRSPQRRRQQTRIVPRYMVQVPKLSLDIKESNVVSLRGRYNNLYIPSDFFNAKFSWVDAFPVQRTFQLGNQCSFHIMSKEVESINKGDLNLEPTDADHLFSAKVMLLSMPTLEEIYHKSCALTEDPTDIREAFQHPTRLIQFLVGMKGKSELMAIGGPWSPSLDGPNPAEDPRVLINTAIRTTRALTGIDLSSCTQWYRFTEIRYHRPEETHKGRLVPARVETVVIFLPDVWSCSPSRLEWEQMQSAYIKQLQDKLAEECKDDSQEDVEEVGEGDDASKIPTHFAELDPKNMKVADLRKELEARTLSSRGLKSQLIARLTKSLKSEQEKEEQEDEVKEEQVEETKVEEEKKMEVDERDEEQKRKEDDERKKKEEREKLAREKKFSLPENPAILVHPSPTAKSGKFECTVMSLSVLLDYRPEDTKEHAFEVSLFAELFNEMLMRDFGYKIFKSLLSAPDAKKDDKAKDATDKEKDKDEKEKEQADEPSNKKRKTSQENDEKDEKKEDSSRDRKDSKEESKDAKESEKDEEKGNKEGEKDSEEEPEEQKDKERHRSRDKDRDKDKDKDKEKDKDKDKKREKLKYQTVHRDLLLAFVYFDQSHTGYLLDKDIEEILHTLGLQLSRAQVKKLVQKLVTRDTLNYRKLTDKPTLRDSDADGESRDDTDEQSEVLDQELIFGNLPHLQKGMLKSTDKAAPSSDTDKGETKDVADENATSKEASGFVMYNGAMIDINSVMQRLDRSEKTRAAVEDKLKAIQEEMESVRSSYNTSEQNSQKVSQELQEMKKKLRDQKKQTDTVESNAKRYSDILNKSKSTLSTLMGDIRDVIEAAAVVKKEDIKQEVVNGD